MATRMAHNDDDSLELLLDTICNVFGGIILMAILVVLQTQTTIDRIPVDNANPEASLEVEQLQFELSRIDTQLAELRDSKKMLDEKFNRTATPETAVLLERRDDFIEAIDRAEKRLKEIEDDRKNRQEHLTDSREKQRELERQATEDRNTLADLAAAQQRKIAIRATKVRLPRRHESSTSRQRIYLVVGKSVYRLADGWLQPGTTQAGGCKVTPTDGGRAHRVEPRPGAGMAMPGAPKEADAFAAVLTRDSAAIHLISFFVKADSASFATFQVARAVAVSKGYEYSSGYYQGLGVKLWSGSPPAE